ncbi:MAG TPA: hypothetical protein VE173_01670, partial [Longimicrobiales bacterium]|nr:hypothetical protein [Longimicrobiales bacterium]
MSRALRSALVAVVLAVGAVALALAVGTVPLAAQQWWLDARGGRYRLEGGPVGAASTGAALGLRYLDDRSWLGLFAGFPVDDGTAPWGTAAATLSLTRGQVPLVGVRVSGQASLQGDQESASPTGGRGR